MQPAGPATFGLSQETLRSAALGLWVGQLAFAFRCTPTRSFRCGRPAGVSGVGPQSTNLGACDQASGEHGGCLSLVHCPGLQGGGAPEASAAEESSLTSP